MSSDGFLVPFTLLFDSSFSTSPPQTGTESYPFYFRDVSYSYSPIAQSLDTPYLYVPV